MSRGWNESEHPRHPAESPDGRGGQFRGKAAGVGGGWVGEVDRRLPGGGPALGDPDRMRAAILSGERSRRELSGGIDGKVHLVTFNNGDQLIHKTYGHRDRDAWVWPPPEHRNDSEYYTALVGHALEAPVPAVIRDENNPTRGTYQHYVPGAPTYLEWDLEQVAQDMDAADDEDISPSELERLLYSEGLDDADMPATPFRIPQGMSLDSDPARRLGLLDFLIDNRDRHDNNYLRDSNGDPIGIDHGRAFYGGSDRRPDFGDRFPPFTHYLVGNGYYKPTDLNPASLREAKRRIKKLRDEFVAGGREDWYNGIQARLDQLALYAEGKRRLW